MELLITAVTFLRGKPVQCGWAQPVLAADQIDTRRQTYIVQPGSLPTLNLSASRR